MIQLSEIYNTWEFLKKITCKDIFWLPGASGNLDVTPYLLLQVKDT